MLYGPFRAEPDAGINVDKQTAALSEIKAAQIVLIARGGELVKHLARG